MTPPPDAESPGKQAEETSEDLAGELRELRARVEELSNRVDDREDRGIADFGMGQEPVLGGMEIPDWVPGSGGGGLDGYRFILADGSTAFVSNEDAIAGYDPAVNSNWSLEWSVADGKIEPFSDTAGSENPVGTTDVELWNGDASTDPVTDQTFWRIPIIRAGKRVSRGGVFLEAGFCAGTKGCLLYTSDAADE